MRNAINEIKNNAKKIRGNVRRFVFSFNLCYVFEKQKSQSDIVATKSESSETSG